MQPLRVMGQVHGLGSWQKKLGLTGRFAALASAASCWARAAGWGSTAAAREPNALVCDAATASAGVETPAIGA